MRLLVLLWVLESALLLAVIIGRGRRGGVLMLAYFSGLSLIHVPGAVDYLGQAPGLNQETATYLGFKATLIGLACLLAGSVYAQLTVRVRSGQAAPGFEGRFRRSSIVMMLVGAGVYFIVAPLSVIIPSATAVLSSIGSLLPFGFWLYFYSAVRDRSLLRMIGGIALLPLLPLSTMISGGFISNGMSWMIGIVALIYVTSRWKRLFVIAAPVALVLGLSAAVAYFGGRSELRDAVWYQQASLGARLDRVQRMVETFELVDFNNPTHVQFLDSRLNQNYFVGLAILRHEAGEIELARGGTVPWWALVPRALWPDKPAVGGGRTVVADATGLELSLGTSWGAGQPLEFYVNFGWPGIVIGFLWLGYVLMRLDMVLVMALRQEDMARLLRVSLPGLALLQPGGNLLEILVATVGAVIAARILTTMLRHFGYVGSRDGRQHAVRPGAAQVARQGRRTVT